MTTESKATKYEKHAARLMRDVFKRQFPATEDVFRLAYEIGKIVHSETSGLTGELAATKVEVQSLTRRLSQMGYDGPLEVGKHKRKPPRLRAMAENAERNQA